MNFEKYAASLIGDKNILIISEIGKEEETILRLSLVGLDNIKGYLKGGIESWKGSWEKLRSISIHDLKKF